MDKWTKTPPTEPGWYWVYELYSQDVFVKHLINVMGDLTFDTGVKLTAFPIKDGVQWLGPLSVPEKPEE